MLWVLIRIASSDDSNEHPQHMFLWRNDENYHSIIIKYPPYLSLLTVICFNRVTRCPDFLGWHGKITFNSSDFFEIPAYFLHFKNSIFTILGDLLLENNASFGQMLALISSFKICGRFSQQPGQIYVEKWSLLFQYRIFYALTLAGP